VLKIGQASEKAHVPKLLAGCGKVLAAVAEIFKFVFESIANEEYLNRL